MKEKKGSEHKMAFGITRQQLERWKDDIDQGKISFLTHYWRDKRFPDCTTVTKVGCNDLGKLTKWGARYGLKEEWIHHRKDGYSHFDLLGHWQKRILLSEKLYEHIW